MESPSRRVDLIIRGLPLLPSTDIKILKEYPKHELKDDLSQGSTPKSMLKNMPGLQTTQKADNDDSGTNADTG